MSRLMTNHNRANAEIIFIGLLTLVISSAGVIGMNMAFTITEETEENINPPEVQLQSTDTVEMEYSSNEILTDDNTKKLYLENESGHQTTLFSANSSSELRTGTTFSEQRALENVSRGENIKLIWEQADGDSQIVKEYYIPTENVQGNEITSNGTDILNGSFQNDTSDSGIELT